MSVEIPIIATPAEKRDPVALIVPFREDYTGKRKEQLDTFLDYYTAYLRDCDHIFVVEQREDGRRFNRGALLNIGLITALGKGYPAAITHDVDLLSSCELKEDYRKPEHGTLHHIAALWPRYNSNPDYLGGIVAASIKTWRSINGYPNHFWGWGGEDDALSDRAKARGVNVTKPKRGTISDLESLSLEGKLASLKKARNAKNPRKWEDREADRSMSMVRGMNSVTWRERGTVKHAGYDNVDHFIVSLH